MSLPLERPLVRLFISHALNLVRWLVLAQMVFLFGGCGRNEADKALETDANGFLCSVCNAKFYTARDVFPDFCPACHSPQIVRVLGFICKSDNYTTMGPRSRASMKCEKCGMPTSSLSIPHEADLRAWGAAKKTRREVCGS